VTPEGRVKAAVNKLLAKYKRVYRFMPVQYGYGESTLDFLICVNGNFLAIETKTKGKKPTARQRQVIEKITAAGGTALVIDDAADLTELQEYLEKNHHVSNKPQT
jgi:hypothetical protein